MATFESRNFIFTAFGTTKIHASKVLLEGLAAHGKEYELPYRWWANGNNEEFIESNVSFSPVEEGHCYRDRELLK